MVIAIIDFTAIILHRRCIKVCKSWVWAIVSLDFFLIPSKPYLIRILLEKREICFYFAKTLFPGLFAFHFKLRILRKPLIFVLSCIDINCYAQYSETSTSDEINSFALSFVSFDTIYHSHSYLGISFRSWEFSRSRFVFKRGARVTGIKNESQVIRTEWRMRKMHFPKGSSWVHFKFNLLLQPYIWFIGDRLAPAFCGRARDKFWSNGFQPGVRVSLLERKICSEGMPEQGNLYVLRLLKGLLYVRCYVKLL